MNSVYKYEGFGNIVGHIELELMLDIGRPLTDDDKWNIKKSMDKMLSLLHERTISVNPVVIEEAKITKQNILKLFKDHKIYVKEIPNSYCSDYCCKHLPWFEVTTTKGTITIGWRKRVIEIDWSKSDVEKKSNELFLNEDVTKGDYYIHAWGYEKAQEYIDIILLN